MSLLLIEVGGALVLAIAVILGANKIMDVLLARLGDREVAYGTAASRAVEVRMHAQQVAESLERRKSPLVRLEGQIIQSVHCDDAKE